ncbi:HAD family hydrolase [Streptacidiphilus jiangxiensis]|uniref:Haloacid dehalogenase superfamily, subfamily IA, variant 3 with third motif having DD or ED n=1 Tax=Streptacidiphilus jiangxiensis TaxID=235985 RepID=A0A1H7QM26_STRJI|nr:HAD-IA family hydrolase [Streptacidiphilus jiangxiensis]SEL48665.1 haloacid dehalogenase superfamily, subfamily IA, variant 3 with third motif having DD or ED [Streptacidiphilus jiangxiensis]
MKKYILFDHDGVLVDTEFWYHRAGERALADIGLALDKDQYLRDMNLGLGTWAQARAAGVDERIIDGLREARDAYYQEYLRTEAIEIDGVVEALAELSEHVRMAVVTTAKRRDFELIHQKRRITRFMDFVLVREDYELAKPHPEPYLTGLRRFGATREETLVVEDSPRGLNSALAAGIDCVVVHNEFMKAHDFSQASHRIDTLAELRDIVLATAREPLSPPSRA